MTHQSTNAETAHFEWNSLYKIGGAAALIAGVIFRRNIAAEIGLFSQETSPVNIGDWFALLQNNRLLALAYLNIFDVVNYVLLALMFLALYAALHRTDKSAMAIAAMLAFVGTAIYFASNTAFSMVALSDQYAAATAEADKNSLLAAGQAMLAMSRFTSPGGHPGGAGYMSLLLVAMAGLVSSVVMLRSTIFNRATAWVGILANVLDLAYCIAYVFVPVESEVLAVSFIPAAGLFLMVWHILAGWQLYRLGRIAEKKLLQG